MGPVVREYPHYSVVNVPLWGTEMDRAHAVATVAGDARSLMAGVDVAVAVVDQASKN